jgi:hypothetical protein
MPNGGQLLLTNDRGVDASFELTLFTECGLISAASETPTKGTPPAAA